MTAAESWFSMIICFLGGRSKRGPRLSFLPAACKMPGARFQDLQIKKCLSALLFRNRSRPWKIVHLCRYRLCRIDESGTRRGGICLPVRCRITDRRNLDLSRVFEACPPAMRHAASFARAELPQGMVFSRRIRPCRLSGLRVSSLQGQ